MQETIQKHLFSVDEYYKLAELKSLPLDQHFELIEGEIFDMSPIGISHASMVDRLNHIFHQRILDQALIRVQNPLRLGDHSEVEPDILLLKYRSDYYSKGHPQAKDVLLLVEVADTSLGYDKEIKLPIYAKAGISEVWIIDLNQNIIEVFQKSDHKKYKKKTIFSKGQCIQVQCFPNISINIDGLF